MEGRRAGKKEVCEGGTESKPGGKRGLRKEQERKGWGEKTEERKRKRGMGFSNTLLFLSHVT